jgi:adenylate kinase
LGLRVVVVGIPGVGKTTVVEGLVRGYRGAKMVNFGTLMFERGLSLGLAKNRDEMRKLPVERQRKLQKEAASKIAGMREGLVVVDTHLFIRTPEGFWPGLPFDVVRAMKPTHLVLVEATTDEIAERRSADRARYRDPVTKANLAEELSLARSFITVSSTLTGAPMYIVRNHQGKQKETTAQLVRMLKGAGR